jgi:hypothetical protein
MRGMPIAIEAIIKPSWLKVESAIIFLKSVSKVAAIPAVVMVKAAARRRINLKGLESFNKGKKRIRRNTPAVTSVEE